MKKQLITSLLSLLFTAGLACAQTTQTTSSTTTTDSTTTCPSTSKLCANTAMECVNGKLNKEECKRFCDAKAAAVAADPSLAKPENKCALCRAIIKADPSMKPIIMKMRKNCPKNQHCNMTSTTQESIQKSADAAQSSAAAAQSSADAALNSANAAKEVTSTETTTSQTSASH